jgi:hypothetical protein
MEHVAQNRDRFLTAYRGIAPPRPEAEPDVLLYIAFTVCWALVRSAIEAQGIYGNHRTQCLEDFRRTCGSWVDLEPFDGLFQAWEDWEAGAPEMETLIRWCQGMASAAAILRERLGPDESEAFAGWPPRTI